jgi:predicted nuclease of predicted toxin-antitoxin system
MKFLVDAHIGNLIIEFLERAKHDVLRATNFPPKTSDSRILQIAAAEGRVVLTSDKDFGELVFRLQQPTVGVVLLRIDVPHEADRLAVLQRFWPAIESSVPGHFVVVTSKMVRKSPLPDAP